MPLPFSAEPSSTGQISPSRSSLRQIVEHLVARRRHVFQQLLHQLVVIIGELLQHGEPRLLLSRSASASGMSITSLAACSR